MPRFALRSPAGLAVVLACAAALLAGCTADTVEPPGPDRAFRDPAGSIVIVPDVFCPLAAPCGTVTAGDSIHFIAYQLATDGTPTPVKDASWDVSDPAVATVSREGWVRGVSIGDVTLSVSKGHASADTLLSVQAARFESVRLSSAGTTIPVGGTVQLSAVLVDVLGEEHPAESIFWFVHNPTVASVSEQGEVHGLSDGQVIVSGFGPDNTGGWVALQVGSGSPRATGLELDAVSVGAHHTCGVTPGGEAYCWGWNFYGQLGQGFFSSEQETFGTPLLVASGTGFRTVSGGSFHTCALDTDGKAWCWGANMSGQGGTGAIGDAHATPIPVADDATYRTVSAGGDHTCALRTDGVPACWGANYFGQMGNGTTEPSGSPTRLASRALLVSVRAGLWHNCGLTADGAALCWGDNSMGQVGNGKAVDGTFLTVPSRVRTSVHFTTLETSAASSHT